MKAATIFTAILVFGAASTSFGTCQPNASRTGRNAHTVAPSSHSSQTSQVKTTAQAVTVSNAAAR